MTDQDIQFYNEIERRKIEWLWPGYIPKGKLTVFAGLQGIGKGFITCDILARLSSEQAWPDGKLASLLGYYVYATGEDDPHDTIGPRLYTAGASLSRVAHLKGVPSALTDKGLTKELHPFNLRQHMKWVESRAKDGMSLLVLDPLDAFLGGVNSWSNADLRTLLMPYVSMLQETGLTIIGIMHLRKSNAADFIHRVAGSIAFTAVARQVLLTIQTAESRYVGPIKSNIGLVGSAMEYMIPQIEDGVPKVEWLGPSNRTMLQIAEEYYTEPSGYAKEKIDKAVEWLEAKLDQKDAWEAKELIEEAKGQGVTRTTLHRARVKLGIKTRPVHAGGKVVAHEWYLGEPKVPEGPKAP